MQLVRESVLTCPRCGFSKRETTPADACQFYYECEQCKTVLRPRTGDCCVYCSYGSVPCPPVQLQRNCCSPPGAQAGAPPNEDGRAGKAEGGHG